MLRIQPGALPPRVFVQEHGPQLGELLRRILERGQDDRALIDRERQQRHTVGEGNLEPVGERILAGGPNRVGETTVGRSAEPFKSSVQQRAEIGDHLAIERGGW